MLLHESRDKHEDNGNAAGERRSSREEEKMNLERNHFEGMIWPNGKGLC